MSIKEIMEAKLEAIELLKRELDGQESPEINADDTGITYFYTISAVEWAIERTINQIKGGDK